MKRSGIFLSILATWAFSMTAFAEAGISDLSFRQRFPWNGLIDIKYTVAGLGPSEIMSVNFSAKFNSKTFEWVRVGVGNGVHTNVIDISTGDRLGTDAVGDMTLAAMLTEPEEYDVNTGTDYQGSEYLAVDLVSGAVSNLGVLDNPEAINLDEYKTSSMVFRHIRPGKFYMQGTSSANGTLVTMTKHSWFAAFPMTVAQYSRIMATDMSSTNKLPQICNWNSARGASAVWPSVARPTSDSILGKLTTLVSASGYYADLPTEAEWERAARGGTRTARFCSDAELTDYAWYRENSGSVLMGVGLKKPNPWGFYDIYGGVWEWVLDWAGAIPFGTDPVGPASGSERVDRGGAYGDPSSYCTSPQRDWHPAAENVWGRGIRIVLKKDE